ncbi:MAG: hypothetical protein WB780_12590 [Candidatus Acidiferrales bacterium]
MKRWHPLFLIVTVWLIAAACSKPSTNSTANQATASTGISTAAPPADAPARTDQDAIAEAIRKHLASNSTINMAVMDMDVSKVSISGDQAQATADFRLKQGGTTMQVNYLLDRHAGTWIVLRSQPAGGQFAHPPMDKMHSGTAIDASHPAIPNIHEFFKNVPPPGEAGNPPAGANPNPSSSP